MNEDWIKEFDRQFLSLEADWSDYSFGTYVKTLKSFISKLLSTERGKAYKQGHYDATMKAQEESGALIEEGKQAVLRELLKEVQKIDTTLPGLESDMYDKGMAGMKSRILFLLDTHLEKGINN